MAIPGGENGAIAHPQLLAPAPQTCQARPRPCSLSQSRSLHSTLKYEGGVDAHTTVCIDNVKDVDVLSAQFVDTLWEQYALSDEGGPRDA